MPCSDYSDADEIHDLSGQVKELTQIACDLAKHAVIRACKPATRVWVEAHNREDQRRIRIEEENRLRKKVRNRVLAKLTEEEREILGVR